MFYLVTGILVFFALVCYALVHSKFGKILTAIRDNEFRVMALGYNTAMFKTTVFALSGLMAGLAGALFVAANQSCGPQFFHFYDSIEVVIFVAIGGRGTLVGAILGALLVNWGKDYINNAFSVWWPVVLGGLFVSVVLFLPEGIVGGVPRFIKFLRLWFVRRPGLSPAWNRVRVAIGLLYWGIFLLSMAAASLVVAGIIAKRPVPATTQQLFGGLVGSICYWMLMVGTLMTLGGLVLCGSTPAESRSRAPALASIAALAVFVVVGFFAVAGPLNETRHIIGLTGFGGLGVFPVAVLLLTAALFLAFFAVFLQKLAFFYKHEPLARSTRGFLVLFAAGLASMVVLNLVGPEARAHTFFGPFLYLLTLAYVGTLVILPLWLLKLLFQMHECINRPVIA